MYKRKDQQIRLEDFFQPFNGKPNPQNRWVLLSKQIPWDEYEEDYASQFPSNTGTVALSFRIALGSLIIKERLGVSDEETVEQIRENPYLQYFLGFDNFNDAAPYDSSMLTHFRKRITSVTLSSINERIISHATKKGDEKADVDMASGDCSNNNGKLLIDSTCAPADIRYPTDIGLLNDAREKSERIIDELWSHTEDLSKKPRTYRRLARKFYLSVVKKKRVSSSQLRKGIRKQLCYLQRNLSHIDKLKEVVSFSNLSNKQYRELLVIGELYRQQLRLYESKSRSIPDRIVSISQPHIRPIVRGKVKNPTEFGAKISVSVVDGYTYLDRLSWDNYNEGEDLKKQIEAYKNRFGHYPESVHSDKIYRNRENRKFCKEHNIRLSGPPLGRPKSVTNENREKIRQEKKIARQDEIKRIEIEGKFGVAKRKFGLSRIMAKLAETSETAISITFIVMNLEHILRKLLYFPKYILQIFVGNTTLKIKSTEITWAIQ